MYKKQRGIVMDALDRIITGRDISYIYGDGDALSSYESAAVKTLGAKDAWIQSTTILKPEQYESYVNYLFEKTKTKSGLIVVCTDVPLVLALKIAFAAGAKKHQNIYLLCPNGEITKI